MDKTVICIFFVCNIIHCYGVSFREQLEHIYKTRLESLGLNGVPTRRIVEYNTIFGVPSQASHLPEAEAILPGHTLLRPALGMLKSSIKFPHKDLDAGVYGNYETIGIRYNGNQERVLYSGFRRALSDYLMLTPVNLDRRNPKIVMTPVVLNLDKPKHAEKVILKLYELMQRRNSNKKKRRKKRNKMNKKSSLFSNMFIPDSSSAEKIRKRPKALRHGPVDVEYEDDLQDHQDSDGVSTDNDRVIDNPPTEGSEERRKNYTKMELLFQTMGQFDHIKYKNPNVPSSDVIHLPLKFNISNAIINPDIRNWWFYHQEDFVPFMSKEIN